MFRTFMRGKVKAARAACAVVAALWLDASIPSASQPARAAQQCQPAGPLVRLPDLPEASGIAVSGRVPGRLWAHNDSGRPEIFALDTRGAVTARLQLSGATVVDWEAIAVGPCPAGSCLYVADIGDNDAQRRNITIYRLPEPANAIGSAAVPDVFHATYPDGPHDAESLLIAPDARLYIVTKGDSEPVAVYRFPGELRSGASVRLERVGSARDPGKRENNDDRFTDAAMSPDGEWVVLRTNRALAFYRTTELMATNWRAARRVDLRRIGESQGEGVAFGADNTIYLAGEGGNGLLPGTFARLTCTPGN